MTAYISISQIYWNKHSLGGFFFRDQAYETLEELIERSSEGERIAIDILDDQTDDMDIDEVEEMFYSDSIEELADHFGLELEEKETEEEDDE